MRTLGPLEDLLVTEAAQSLDTGITAQYMAAARVARSAVHPNPANFRRLSALAEYRTAEAMSGSQSALNTTRIIVTIGATANAYYRHDRRFYDDGTLKILNMDLMFPGGVAGAMDICSGLSDNGREVFSQGADFEPVFRALLASPRWWPLSNAQRLPEDLTVETLRAMEAFSYFYMSAWHKNELKHKASLN